MEKGLWSTIKKPIIGLSPMDGVTDAPFRLSVAKYGNPDLIITEFTSVEGLRAGATRLLDDFHYHPLERPILAQLFGADPQAFYSAALVVAALGFDGVDINMGCPAKNVTSHGAGAALILDPPRAKEIIRQTRRGLEDWQNGLSLEEAGISLEIQQAIAQRRHALGIESTPRVLLPVSVKTRLGYDLITVLEWVKHLLEEEPAAITLHGRTLKQLYTGSAHWEAIGEAAALIHQTDTLVLGNGDLVSVPDALAHCQTYLVDGALIGRACFGNPWIFQDRDASWPERASAALEQARYFAELFPPNAFVRMRKHLLDYCKGFEGAKEVRIALMRVSSLSEVEEILRPHLPTSR